MTEFLPIHDFKNLPSGDAARAWDAVVWGSAPAPGAGEGDVNLRRVLDAVVGRLGFDRAGLYLLSTDRTRLDFVLRVGQPLGDSPPSLDPEGERFEAQVLRCGRLTIGNSAGGADGLVRTTACAPIRARGDVIGVLVADRSSSQGAVTREEAQALAVFSDQTSGVLENWRLAEENRAKIGQFVALQRITREMTSTLDIGKLLGMVAEEALLLTGAEGALLYLLEPAAERLRLEARAGQAPPPGRQLVPIGYGIAGWVARNGKPLRVSDRGSRSKGAAFGSRKSQLAVPLLSEGAVVGVLAVDGRREEAFSETHEEILGIFAAQAAKAIEAARFFQGVRQERDFRDRILGGTPNGVVALDSERRIVWLNESARKLLALDEEPVGNPVERYLPFRAFQENLHRVLAGQSSLENIEVSIGKGLQARHLLINVFLHGEGELRGAALILQDLTQQRRLDEQVHRMERLASIGQLAAGIAHEIRNPLTGVGITLDILRDEEGLSADGRGLLDDINREIDRLEHLIRGLLDFARPHPVQKRPLRVAKALEWHATFREQCAKKEVRFRLELGENPRIEGDPEKLKQVFLNLALNALEATEPGGEVRVVSRVVDGDGRRWVRVTVEDTGRGMDPDTLSQVFNPFFTTKSEGTGLGLAIAHSIVEQHGGSIDLQSSPGAGTRFVVDLPALEQKEE